MNDERTEITVNSVFGVDYKKKLINDPEEKSQYDTLQIFGIKNMLG